MGLLTLPMLVGCGRKKTAGTYSLTIWEDKSNLPHVQELCSNFVKDLKLKYKNAPTINFKFVEQTEKSAIEKMRSGVAESGNGPDIVAVTHDTIVNGYGDVINEITYPIDVREICTEQAVLSVSVGNKHDKLGAYPITADSQVFFYDKRRVNDSQVGDFSTLLTGQNKIGLQLTGANGAYYSWCLYSDSVLFGTTGMDKSDVQLGTAQTVINVTSFYRDFLSHVDDNSPEYTVNYFDTNPNFVGLVSTPFILSTLRNKIPEEYIGVAPIPKLNGVTLRPFSGYKAYAVSRYSTEPILANALCKYLSDYKAFPVHLMRTKTLKV